jgi:hypothetical protein
MTAVYLGTEKSVLGETSIDKTKAVRPCKKRYPTFSVSTLPAIPSSSRTVVRLSALGLILLCTWLIVA